MMTVCPGSRQMRAEKSPDLRKEVEGVSWVGVRW